MAEATTMYSDEEFETSVENRQTSSSNDARRQLQQRRVGTGDYELEKAVPIAAAAAAAAAAKTATRGHDGDVDRATAMMTKQTYATPNCT